MPSLRCRLLDISEGGARCCSEHVNLEVEFARQSWSNLLKQGKPLQIEVVSPGGAARFRADAEVRHLRTDADGQVEFGIRFANVDSGRQQALALILRTFSAAGSGQHTATETGKSARLSDIFRGEAGTAAMAAGKRATTRRSDTTVLPQVAAPAAEPDGGGLGGLARSLWGKVTGSGRMKAVSEPAATASGSSSSARLHAEAVDSSTLRSARIGEILQRMGKLTPQQAVKAYEESRAAGKKYGAYLVEKKRITPADLCRALSIQTGLPTVDLANLALSPQAGALFAADTVKHYQFVPFNIVSNTVYIAVALPLASLTLTKLEKECGRKVRMFLTRDDALVAHLSQMLASKAAGARGGEAGV